MARASSASQAKRVERAGSEPVASTFRPLTSIWQGTDAALLERMLKFYLRERPQLILDAIVNAGPFWSGTGRSATWSVWISTPGFGPTWGPTTGGSRLPTAASTCCSTTIALDAPKRASKINTRSKMAARLHAAIPCRIPRSSGLAYMEVLRPKCNQVLGGSDINVVTDIARCRRCDEVFVLSSLVQARAFGPVNLDDPPRGAWYRREFNGFVVGASMRHPMAFFLVPFMCVWSGFSLGGIYGTQIVQGRLNLFMSLFGIPFILGTLLFGTLARWPSAERWSSGCLTPTGACSPASVRSVGGGPSIRPRSRPCA